MTITLLNNRYRVIQVLGVGGFGETFLAEDTHMPSRRRCVIKQLKPIANDPKTYQLIQQRFEREAATLEFLGENSEQIPQLYAYFSENGLFYLVQEWIQGQTLTEIVKAKGQLKESVVREILLSLLSVLDYVHSKGIIHRDIKPDNIILRTPSLPEAVGGKPVLIDFGAVKETIRSVVNLPGNPTQSLIIGTPGYMPSEQAVGRPVYATDIYSLGLTAIYLLTAQNPQELQTNPQTGEILWQQHAYGVSLDLAKIINQAIKPQASDRYSTASKMLYALKSATATPTATPTVAKPTQALSSGNTQNFPATNWQKPAWIIGGVVVGSLMGAVAIAHLNSSTESEVPIATSSESTLPQSPITNLTPTPEPTVEITETPVVKQPSITPIRPNTPKVQQPETPEIIPQPEAIAPQQENEPPVILETPTNPTASEVPSPEIVTPTPEETPTPQKTTPPRNISVGNPIRQNVPAFPIGTPRSNVEATLGKPAKDSRGVWRNTRAISYNLVPNQIDLGYLFDRDSGQLRQTEAAFAQTVDIQVIQNTLNGMLGSEATEEIKQGLQQLQQRQIDNFTFTKGTVKGQIVRQDCDFIYISIWDADLHDFVSPAQARRC
ncbi:serine/threonine-protein kinase [Iningainema tapete]|uniref:non-specific serine/threonine protein kinase n=1 Tax=Iningainema tapete BLCC-T55 TaxID=2748662 RepID=A0A8J6XFI6_9CYAN|nr:serine/threonine-protein kinase [Iningainema tapete]MBD2774789.1 protein kinase [Iningainema tapete BLCC-T55]